MAKNQTDATEVVDPAVPTEIPVDAAAIDAPAPISLDEFCIQLSQKEPRVELISGFHYTELAAGNARDTAEAYQARFVAFLTKPA